MRRENTAEKLGITAAQRLLSLEKLQKLAYASSDAEYDHLYADFVSVVPSAVASYFNTNWHGIKNEWVLGMKSCSGNFLNFTNNRLESLKKQVIDCYSTLKDFFEKFFVILSTLRIERDHKVAMMMQVNRFSSESPEYLYSNYLTSYASQFVLNQLSLMLKVNPVDQDNGEYTIESYRTVTSNDCECIFYKSMLLPCRHIFALRKKLDLPLYDPSLCNKRWTFAYYQ